MTDSVTSASPAEANVDTPAPTAPVQDVKPTTVEPSTTEGASPPSMLDAVKTALNKTPEATEAPPASVKAETTEAPVEQHEDDEHPDDGKISDDEKKHLAPKTQRRIQKLAGQVSALREPAERFQRLDTFMKSNGLGPQDAVGALEIAALMQTDPAAAYDRLSELSLKLAQRLGKVLPQDIHDRVQKGIIDEATGKELAQTRAKAAELEVVTSKTTEQIAAERTAALRQQVSTAVTTWEKLTAARDPDFARKKPLVEAQFRSLIQSGAAIQSGDDAVAIARKAYGSVNETLKGFAPAARPEIRPTPATASTAAAPRPATFEDAIRQRLVGSAAA